MRDGMKREKRRSYFKNSKTAAAAAILAFSLLAASCGNAGKDEHGGHGSGQAVNQLETSGKVGDEQNEHAGHDMSQMKEDDGKYEAADGVVLEWNYSPASPKQGEETRIELLLKDENGKPIEKYDLNHEKLMHLILVSNDLNEFNHIHPEYVGDGKFVVETAFADSGSHMLYADFIPTGSSQKTATSTVMVKGEKSAAKKLTKDAELTKTVETIEASLAISTLKAGEESELTFTLRDAKSKEEITDLEPYLGAIGHVVILSGDLKRYLHVHPTSEIGSGPNADFATTFPEPGLYKIWGQFQRGGETFIIPFTVEVEK